MNQTNGAFEVLPFFEIMPFEVGAVVFLAIGLLGAFFTIFAIVLVAARGLVRADLIVVAADFGRMGVFLAAIFVLATFTEAFLATGFLIFFAADF